MARSSQTEFFLHYLGPNLVPNSVFHVCVTLPNPLKQQPTTRLNYGQLEYKESALAKIYLFKLSLEEADELSERNWLVADAKHSNHYHSDCSHVVGAERPHDSLRDVLLGCWLALECLFEELGLAAELDQILFGQSS